MADEFALYGEKTLHEIMLGKIKGSATTSRMKKKINIPQEVCQEMSGEAITFFRIYLKRRSPRTFNEMYNILGQVPYHKCRAEIKDCLSRNIKVLKEFFEKHEKYFTIDGDCITVKPTRTKEEIEAMLSLPAPSADDETHQGANIKPAKPSDYRQNLRIISRPGECADIVLQIMSRPSVVALDCEGEGLGTYGRLSLIQLATCDGKVYLFDILATKYKQTLFVHGKLQDLLESNDVIKVMHNCRGDSTTLHDELGINLQNVFDTESAYQTLLEQYNIERRQTNPGLNHIVTLFGGPTINTVKESGDVKMHMIYDRYYWSRRPMSSQMIQYAAKDVSVLVPTVYNNINRMIGAEWRSRLKALCQENIDCHLNRK